MNRFPAIALLTTLTAVWVGGIQIPAASARAKCRDFATQQEAQAYMQHGASNTAVNLQLVREGYAVVYYQYLQNCQELCTPLQQAEAQAKNAHLNFWNQANPVMPWDYRRSQRR